MNQNPTVILHLLCDTALSRTITLRETYVTYIYNVTPEHDPR